MDCLCSFLYGNFYPFGVFVSLRQKLAAELPVVLAERGSEKLCFVERWWAWEQFWTQPMGCPGAEMNAAPLPAPHPASPMPCQAPSYRGKGGQVDRTPLASTRGELPCHCPLFPFQCCTLTICLHHLNGRTMTAQEQNKAAHLSLSHWLHTLHFGWKVVHGMNKTSLFH